MGTELQIAGIKDAWNEHAVQPITSIATEPERLNSIDINQPAANAENNMNLTPVAAGIKEALSIQAENTVTDSADVAHINLQCAGGMLGELCGQVGNAANELTQECKASPHARQPEIVVVDQPTSAPTPLVYNQDFSMS